MKRTLRPVLRSDDLPPAAPGVPGLRRIRVGRRDVLVARLPAGDVVAFSASCPHEGTALDEATLWDGHLRCPTHLYLYDPRSGENVLPARRAKAGSLWKLKPGYLPTYRAEERGGWIWVASAPEPPPAGYDRARERRPLLGRRRVPAVAPGPPGPVVRPKVEAVEHPVEEVSVAAGAELELLLPTSPRPGHFWQVDAPPAPLVLVELRHESADGASRSRVRLVATAPGEATVRCTYGTPVEPAPKEVRTFRVRISPA